MTTSPLAPASHPDQPVVRMHGYGSTATTEVKLYCFPHAGGAAPFYRSWPMLLPPGVELRAVQLPGRQDLAGAPAFTDLDSLARAAADAVAEDAQGLPFAFFGHSMGALTAFETARELRRRDLAQPVLLGLSAHSAPHLDKALPPQPPVSDQELLDQVTSWGGIPADVLRSPELLEIVLPVLRADFTAIATYQHTPEPPLDSPFALFGGTSDAMVSEEALDAWRQYSSGPVTVEHFSGDHFYLTRWSSRILATICSRLGR